MKLKCVSCKLAHEAAKRDPETGELLPDEEQKPNVPIRNAEYVFDAASLCEPHFSDAWARMILGMQAAQEQARQQALLEGVPGLTPLG